MKNVLVIHGPNLNLIGTREPEIYGSTTLPELEAQIGNWAAELGLTAEFYQSNHEGAIIDALHEARDRVDAVLINAGALTHYSYALYDALVAIDKLTVEVHISDIHSREDWRRLSVTAPASDHVIYGRGIRGYYDGLRRLMATAAAPPLPIPYGPAAAQYGELRVPSGRAACPVAVLLHGGFWHDVWTLDLMDSLAVDLLARGYATWNVEYHRVGSGGGWPLTMEDVGAGFDHLAELAESYSLDLDRIAAVGHSAGGQLALWAAARPGLHDVANGPSPRVVPQRVIALAPVTDLAHAYERGLGDGAVERFVRRTPDTGPERYAAASPIELLPLGREQLIVHGDLDDHVPVEMSWSYVKQANSVGDKVTMHNYADVDHFDVIDPGSEAWQQAAAWLTFDQLEI